MSIVQVYSRRYQSYVFKLDIRVVGRRIRRFFETQEDALEGAKRLRLEAINSATPARWPHRRMLWPYGWARTPNEVPADPGVYIIVPGPLVGNDVLYVGSSENMRARLRGFGHPWRQLVQEYPDAWITYWLIDRRMARLTLERQAIKRYSPKYQSRGAR